ncbi:MAG TPA: phosphoadenylyl-sulfate reductase [Solirubrobacteraceae bacterium]|nr:phosphoadenylyl-sulfate reductase [Solirubrobacteraceae bacterium]
MTDRAPVATSPPDLEARSAPDVLAHVVEAHHPRLALACSFQKEESVLLHMLATIEPKARVFTIDTGVLFPETLAAWREIERRFGVHVEVHDAHSPDGEPWTADRCCSEHKVAALGRALDGCDAWVTGLRREQSATRAGASKLEWDEAHGLWKANPLADWTDKQVWAYIAEHDLPYNELHDRGYESIGCAPCTQPGAGREGRWAGQDKTECGLHVVPPGTLASETAV